MPSVDIHPTAIVHPEAALGEGTQVGPFALVDGKVRTGKGCQIHAHAVIRDYSTLGDGVVVHPFAVVGGDPQHLKYQGEPTTAVIGDGVTLREYVTINRGTPFGTGTTVVGAGAFIMAYCHVAHDCTVGEGAILANAVQLAGHVTLGRKVVVGGVSAVTQFVRVGDFAFIGGGTLLRKDLPPYLSGKGNDFHVQGVNVVGLEREGVSADSIRALRKLFKIYYSQGLTVGQAALAAAEQFSDPSAEVRAFIEFVATSKQGIAR